MSAVTLIRKEQLQQRGLSLSNLLDETIAVSYPKIYNQLKQNGFVETTTDRRPRNPFTK